MGTTESAGQGGDRPVAMALLAGWTLVAAVCASGMAPAVDLPAQAALLETLAGVVRGDPLVSSVYIGRFVPGYGLVYWLALPLALATDGAKAMRAASFVTLELFALGVLLLVRALRRPVWTLLLALPLAFNVSYWYGFLPFAFATSVGLLTLSALARWVRGGGQVAAALFAGGMALTWCAHLPVAVVLGVAACAAALAQPPERRRATVRLVAAASVLPALLSIPVVLQMLRGVDAPHAGRTVHDPLSHLNWFFHNYRPEGWLSWTLPLVTTLVFAALAWRRRRDEPRAPLAVACALAVLYLLTPRHVVGASHLAVRLPALVALAVLLAADGRALPRWLSAALGILSLVSLGETMAFHLRFREAVSGFSAVAAPRPAGRHAYQPLGTDRVLGSRIPYLYHLGAWETATHGGVGNDLLVGNPQEPLAYRPGQELPAFLRDFTPEQRLALDAIYLFGPGPVPPEFTGFCRVDHAGDWRRLDRCRAGWTLRAPLDRGGGQESAEEPWWRGSTSR